MAVAIRETPTRRERNENTIVWRAVTGSGLFTDIRDVESQHELPDSDVGIEDVSFGDEAEETDDDADDLAALEAAEAEDSAGNYRDLRAELGL